MGSRGELCGEGFGELGLDDLPLKGSGGVGDVSSPGILRFAQNDGSIKICEREYAAYVCSFGE